MRVDLFDFELPPERIALRPVSPRDAARMLCVTGDGQLEDATVLDLAKRLRAGDCLVFNDTRVIPAQLEGIRRTFKGDEARIGATLHKRIDLRRWQAFIRNAKRLRAGDRIEFGADVTAIAQERQADGSFILAFEGSEPVEVLLERAGRMPLPPYIAGKRPTDERDRSDYQTMFADKDGAVAAPTASLHFTPRLMQSLAEAGIGSETLTLHVGAGTFLPVKADDTDDHVMHAEWGQLGSAIAERLNAVRTNGGRIIAVGKATPQSSSRRVIASKPSTG
jgi:S-adenosylmethionine:tRNA ribosyltransferase-isomerase